MCDGALVSRLPQVHLILRSYELLDLVKGGPSLPHGQTREMFGPLDFLAGTPLGSEGLLFFDVPFSRYLTAPIEPFCELQERLRRPVPRTDFDVKHWH